MGRHRRSSSQRPAARTPVARSNSIKSPFVWFDAARPMSMRAAVGTYGGAHHWERQEEQLMEPTGMDRPRVRPGVGAAAGGIGPSAVAVSSPAKADDGG